MGDFKDENNEIKPMDVKKLVADAIEAFRTRFEARSFSDRHPELGKMKKCQICQTRHRTAHVCTQKFATGTHDTRPEGEKTLLIASQTTLKGVYGAAQFAKKRIKPHHSHRMLRLVQLTQDLFPKYYPEQIDDPAKAMHAARGEAHAILRRNYIAARKAKRRANG
jgi:hypothetical protein